jgi:hypothetical protein
VVHRRPRIKIDTLVVAKQGSSGLAFRSVPSIDRRQCCQPPRSPLLASKPVTCDLKIMGRLKYSRSPPHLAFAGRSDTRKGHETPPTRHIDTKYAPCFNLSTLVRGLSVAFNFFSSRSSNLQLRGEITFKRFVGSVCFGRVFFETSVTIFSKAFRCDGRTLLGRMI